MSTLKKIGIGISNIDTVRSIKKLSYVLILIHFLFLHHINLECAENVFKHFITARISPLLDNEPPLKVYSKRVKAFFRQRDLPRRIAAGGTSEQLFTTIVIFSHREWVTSVPT